MPFCVLRLVSGCAPWPPSMGSVCWRTQHGMERRAHAWLEPPAFQRLSEIHVPTLIVAGEPLLFGAPQAVEALSHAIAGARVVLMPQNPP